MKPYLTVRKFTVDKKSFKRFVCVVTYSHYIMYFDQNQLSLSLLMCHIVLVVIRVPLEK